MDIRFGGLKGLLKQALNWGYWLLRLIDARLVLCLGVAIFFLAVGVDSSGNYATAADLGAVSVVKEASVGLGDLVAAPTRIAPDLKSGAQQPDEASYLEFDPEIANRLSHGELTRAVLTGSHLTRAHFFIDAPTTAP